MLNRSIVARRSHDRGHADHGGPVSQLTPESRYHEHYVPKWYRVSDADIDKKLDWIHRGFLTMALSASLEKHSPIPIQEQSRGLLLQSL